MHRPALIPTDAGGGARAIVARDRIAAPANAVVEFLSDLSNHARLAPDAVELLSLDRRPDGAAYARVSLRGPLGIRRAASTELRPAAATPTSIAGIARIGRRTVASIGWTIESEATGTGVTLCAKIDSISALDALVLRAGGRRWIAGHFAAALERLSEELARASAPTTRVRPELEQSRRPAMPGRPQPAGRAA